MLVVKLAFVFAAVVIAVASFFAWKDVPGLGATATTIGSIVLTLGTIVGFTVPVAIERTNRLFASIATTNFGVGVFVAAAGLCMILATGAARFHATIVPCARPVHLEWSGTQCVPHTPEVMVPDCKHTRSLSWLTDELVRVHNASAEALHVDGLLPFKLAASTPNAAGAYHNVWLCAPGLTDAECQVKPKYAIVIGNGINGGVEVVEGKVVIGGPIYLGEDEKTWCDAQMNPIR